MAGAHYGAAENTGVKKPLSVLLPNGDKLHTCGCITFWLANAKAPINYYRNACKAHAGYAYGANLVVAL